MTKNIPVFAAYRQIELFSARNCSADDLYTLVAARGRNTWCVPRLHVPTGYPAQHESIVIDECNPSAWLSDPRDAQRVKIQWSSLPGMVCSLPKQGGTIFNYWVLATTLLRTAWVTRELR